MNKIPVTNVVRLGLALNHALFKDEIQHQTANAIKLAKDAFDLAMTSVTTLKNPEYSDATRLMALLHDNIKVWSKSMNKDDEHADEAAALE